MIDAQYQPDKIEEAAQNYWTENNCFQATENMNAEKFYCLSMFPYPSGSLHMGHVRNYTIGDVISRYQYMLGKNVLQPMGWDAFGLPAENAAIKHKVPPAKWTDDNIAHIRNQLMRMGYAYDWSREFKTCDPEYYKWEQWFFLRLFKKGLVYKKNAEVNWDPVDQTVLANEQVVNNRGWRSGALVERREIPQWFIKITDYAEELLNDLDKLKEWPEQVRTMQKNWIGRSEGVELTFQIKDHGDLSVFTTRPDTIFGATYLALAPQHPIVRQLAKNNEALQTFVQACQNTKLAEADLATMEKLGMPLELTATNPLSEEEIPVWVANFVLMDYGSGALMAVPAHDERDFEFARKYQLPIKQVIEPADNSKWDFDNAAYTQYGRLIDSGEFSDMSSEDAIKAIIEQAEKQNIGKGKVNYRLRDWGVSRQRYWGAPIPIIHCDSCGDVAVPDEDLPVLLPTDVQFEGVNSPLKNDPAFYETTCPQCQKSARRETDTFDTFMESSWYYARFACKKSEKAMLDGRANYWLPVDQYIGGIEHAVLHLLYARFFHKAMRDEGLINSDEPFLRLLSQGMVLNDGIKMSKSKGNTVDPQDLIQRYGADTLRLFTMFAAPPEQSLEWSDSGAEGSFRFLKRLWAYCYENKEIIRRQNRQTESNTFGSSDWEQANIKQTDVFREIYTILDQAKYDYERQQYNTVVSGCMKILNLLVKLEPSSEKENDIQDIIIHRGVSILLRLLNPITPHIAHNLWRELDFQGTILKAEWPKSSPLAFKKKTIEMVVQVNGKLRSKISVPADTDNKTIEDLIKQDDKVIKSVNNDIIKKIIIVPGKLANVVTAPSA